MSRLIVLSEIDCLSYLNSIGVVPHEFYTDFDKFKNMSYLFDDVIIVCLFAGTCSFSKRHVLEYMSSLQKRSEEEQDSGIRGTIILSDTYLPSCNKYYKYLGLPTLFDLYSEWKLKAKDIEIWCDLPHCDDASSTRCFYSVYDKMDTTEIVKRLNALNEQPADLESLIKIPEIG